jgi:Cytochrome C oxidase, cbb3-type, subunit III
LTWLGARAEPPMTSVGSWCKRAVLPAAAVALGATAHFLVPAGVQAFRAKEIVTQDVAQPRSVWDGVYTDEQARRGEIQYGRTCESCHGADLSGNEVDEVPALVWDTFLGSWSGRTVKDLLEATTRAMPREKPGSLSARAYLDVIAYILQANKFPSGSKELDRDPKVLEQIVIERSKK